MATAPLEAVRMRAVTRVVALFGGGVALVLGSWTGLARAGMTPGHVLAGAHGPMMAFGFLGTVIALERAVGARLRGGALAPVASASGVLWLAGGGAVVVAGALFTVAGATVTSIAVRLWRSHTTVDGVVMITGAVAWTIAAALWTRGASPVRLAPVLAAFLVLTIVAERLELSRLRQPSAAAVTRFVVLLTVFTVGVALTFVARRVGLAVAGGGLLALTVWLVRFDIARVTIRRAGLPRFAASAMLAAYGWSAITGILWVTLAMAPTRPLLHDAAMHALFLGFVVSMVFGHAPIVLPAVFRIPPPSPVLAWLALAVLHTSVAARIVVDLAGSTFGRGIATIGNVSAIVVFMLAIVGSTALTHVRVRRAGGTSTRRMGTSRATNRRADPVKP
ncbi:MAG: hypothetical protein WD377_04670 [Nitriliruptoraceae bacterium]